MSRLLSSYPSRLHVLVLLHLARIFHHGCQHSMLGSDVYRTQMQKPLFTRTKSNPFIGAKKINQQRKKCYQRSMRIKTKVSKKWSLPAGDSLCGMSKIAIERCPEQGERGEKKSPRLPTLQKMQLYHAGDHTIRHWGTGAGALKRSSWIPSTVYVP